MGRNEEKRRRTTASIVTAATRLFAERGYDGTTVQAIAEAAGVSAGTVYNYFGTKAAVLAAVVGADVVAAFTAARDTLEVAGRDPADVVLSLLEPFTERMLSHGRVQLREVFRAAYDEDARAAFEELVSMDLWMIEELATTIGAMQREGLIAGQIPEQDAALLLYSIVAMATLMFLSVPSVGEDEVRAHVRSQVVLAMRGIAPGG